MNKKLRNTLYVLGGLVLIVLLTSPRVGLFKSGDVQSASSAGKDQRLPVEAVVLKPEKLSNTIRSTGTVLANEEVELRSEIAGKISRIFFVEGTPVRRGEVLVKIDDSELQAELLKLKSQERLATDKEQRRKELLSKQLISSEDYETALNELNSTRAEIKLTEARTAKTELRAPFDGVVGLRYVSEGSYVSSDSRIATLQNIEHVKVDFSVPEKYATAVRKGQSIKFRTGLSSQAFTGTIYAIEPKIDPVTRTVQLRAMCPNPDRGILPGSFAEVELILQEFREALMIPTEALVPELLGQKVFLYRDGLAEPASVEIGLRTETSLQVTSGLSPGDTVITSGILQLAEGMPVQIRQLR